MPKIFEKILCPVAFDRNSDGAIEFAYDLAHPNMSTLYLLHVVSAPTMELIMLEPNPDLDVRHRQQRARKACAAAPTVQRSLSDRHTNRRSGDVDRGSSRRDRCRPDRNAYARTPRNRPQVHGERCGAGCP
jgi:hypothetical protein